MLTVQHYKKNTVYKSRYLTDWYKFYDKNPVELDELSSFRHKSWNKLFKKLLEDPRAKKTETYLTKIVSIKGKILPYPNLVFHAFEQSLKKIKVVIIGQDPYFNMDQGVPQAMGLSFSVPMGLQIPSSLKNIYVNLYKYRHIKSLPTHGNLEVLIDQGVFFLNSALTVQENMANSHQQYWSWFTDEVIKYIAKKRPDIVFVLWGRNAIDKQQFIGENDFIASSHPSGLSCNKPCSPYSSFMECDFAKDLGIDWAVLNK